MEMWKLTKSPVMSALIQKADTKTHLQNLDASILGGATNEF